MAQDVCVFNLDTIEGDAIYKIKEMEMPRKALIEHCQSPQSDVESDFKELNEEIEKIVEGEKSTNCSRRGSNKSPQKEGNNNLFQTIVNSIWDHVSEEDDSDLFSIKYERLRKKKKSAKKSSFKIIQENETEKEQKTASGCGTFDAVQSNPNSDIFEFREFKPILNSYKFQNRNSDTAISKHVRPLQNKSQFRHINEMPEKIDSNCTIGANEKYFNQNNNYTRTNTLMNTKWNTRECNSMPNQNLNPNVLSHKPPNKFYVFSSYAELNGNNSKINDPNQFSQETQQNEIIKNFYQNSLNYNNGNNVTSQGRLNHNANFNYNNYNYVTGKFSQTIDNKIGNVTNEGYNNQNLNNNKPKPNKKSKKPGMVDNHSSNKSYKVLDDDNNRISLENVIKGKEKRTTIMIRHIPNKYQMKSILDEINQDFINKYDLFYLPLDNDNKCNLGFAFINFIDPMHVVLFYHHFRGKKWKKFNSEKICELAFAKFQGKKDLIAHFEKGAVINYESEDKKTLVLLNPSPIPKIEMPTTYLNAFLTVYPYSNIKVDNEKFIIESLYNC